MDRHDVSFYPQPRPIILVDMNAFFATVEQQDAPKFKGGPVAVTNGEQEIFIIRCFYEARAYNVSDGMRIKQALNLCPHLVVVPSHPRRYAVVSTKIMRALEDITPDIEVFSIDEAFLDVTHCQTLFGTLD